jgi:hypothetical protein
VFDGDSDLLRVDVGLTAGATWSGFVLNHDGEPLQPPPRSLANAHNQRLGDSQSTRLTNDHIHVPVLAFDVEADTRNHRRALLPTHLEKLSTTLAPTHASRAGADACNQGWAMFRRGV